MEKNVRRQESKHALKKHSFKNSIERKQNSTKKWAKRTGPCWGMQRRQYWARALKDLHNRELTRFLQSRLRRLREHRATCCRLMIFRSLLSHSRIGTNCRILDLFMQDPYFQNHAEFLHLHTVGEFSVQNRDSILWGCAFRTRIPHYGAAVTWTLTSRSLDSIYITT